MASPVPQWQKSWQDSWRSLRSIMLSQESTVSSGSTSSISSGGNHMDSSQHHPQQSTKSVVIPKNPKIVAALYQYKTRDKSELAFKKGDKLAILDDYAPG